MLGGDLQFIIGDGSTPEGVLPSVADKGPHPIKTAAVYEMTRELLAVIVAGARGEGDLVGLFPMKLWRQAVSKAQTGAGRVTER